MKVLFLDLKAQYSSIKDEVNPAIQNVLDNTSFILGKHVKNFEEHFALKHNTKHCVGVSSGTDGNHLVLMAMGLKPDDEVIVPVNTFIATAWGATLCNAKPVFVDCHPESYNIDPAKIEEAITPHTKAIVAVHLYGQAADMEGISRQLAVGGWLLEESGVFVNSSTGQKIYLVEDCAQAHLAEYNGKKVGGLGMASSFSFYPGKNLGAYGEAGAVMTNDDELAKKFRIIRDHGAEQKYCHTVYGHNYRMEAIQGAVLEVKLNYLEKWTEARRKNAAIYNEFLSGMEQVITPIEMSYAKHVYHLYVIQLATTEERNKLSKYLNQNEIATGLHYPIPLHLQPCFEHLGYKKGDFPFAEHLAEQGLSLPMYPELTNEQIEFVCNKIIEFFKK